MRVCSLMSDPDRIAATARLLLGAAREAGAFITGDQRVSEVTAAGLLGYSVGGLKNLRLEGNAPDAYRLPAESGSRLSYRLTDLAAWLEARRCR